jgi:hypothetical protein
VRAAPTPLTSTMSKPVNGSVPVPWTVPPPPLCSPSTAPYWSSAAVDACAGPANVNAAIVVATATLNFVRLRTSNLPLPTCGQASGRDIPSRRCVHGIPKQSPRAPPDSKQGPHQAAQAHRDIADRCHVHLPLTNLEVSTHNRLSGNRTRSAAGAPDTPHSFTGSLHPVAAAVLAAAHAREAVRSRADGTATGRRIAGGDGRRPACLPVLQACRAHLAGSANPRAASGTPAETPSRPLEQPENGGAVWDRRPVPPR